MSHYEGSVFVQFSMLVDYWEKVVLESREKHTVEEVRNDVFIVRYHDVDEYKKALQRLNGKFRYSELKTN